MFYRYQRSKRPWQEIAAEASKEMNPYKLLQLYQELDRTFEEIEAHQKETAKTQSPNKAA